MRVRLEDSNDGDVFLFAVILFTLRHEGLASSSPKGVRRGDEGYCLCS
jgi:hypothetical protein